MTSPAKTPMFLISEDERWRILELTKGDMCWNSDIHEIVQNARRAEDAEQLDQIMKMVYETAIIKGMQAETYRKILLEKLEQISEDPLQPQAPGPELKSCNNCNECETMGGGDCSTCKLNAPLPQAPERDAVLFDQIFQAINETRTELGNEFTTGYETDEYDLPIISDAFEDLFTKIEAIRSGNRQKGGKRE